MKAENCYDEELLLIAETRREKYFLRKQYNDLGEKKYYISGAAPPIVSHSQEAAIDEIVNRLRKYGKLFINRAPLNPSKEIVPKKIKNTRKRG